MPTQIGASSTTLIDLFFCNDPDLVSSVLTIHSTSDNDITANVTCAVKNHQLTEPHKVFSYKKGNYSSHSLSLGMNKQWNFFKKRFCPWHKRYSFTHYLSQAPH